MSSGSSEVTLLGHTGPVYSLLLSADNQHLVSGSGDRYVTIHSQIDSLLFSIPNPNLVKDGQGVGHW